MSHLLATALLALAAQDPAATPPPQEPAAQAPDDGFRPDPAWKKLGEYAWFDPEGRTLILRARVALTEGYLEHLLCRERTKEHESVLATDASPRMIHAGLILVAGEPGHGVRYRPEFRAPEGPPIVIEAQWTRDGQTRKVDARTLVKGEKDGKPLPEPWVFAGSEMWQDEETKKVIYAADAGDLITVANFPSAILDVPFASSNTDAERGFVAATENLPPRGTPVTLYLRSAKAGPRPDPKPDRPLTGRPADPP